MPGRTQLNGKAPSSSKVNWRRGRRIFVLLDRYDKMAASVFHRCGKVVGGIRRLLEGRFDIRASSSSSSCRNCLPSSTFHRRGQHGSHPTCGHKLLVSNHSDRKTRERLSRDFRILFPPFASGPCWLVFCAVNFRLYAWR